MTLGLWLDPPRRALTVFLAMALALAAGLAWLGREVVALDRRLEQQRTQVRLSHALDLVVVSLSGWLDEIDRDLAAWAASPDATPAPGQLTEESVFVSIDRNGVRAAPDGRLAYYPDLSDGGDAAIDSGAATLLARATAERRAGRHDAALAIYDELGGLPVTVIDAPAAIVALHARGRLLAVFRGLSSSDFTLDAAPAIYTSAVTGIQVTAHPPAVTFSSTLDRIAALLATGG